MFEFFQSYRSKCILFKMAINDLYIVLYSHLRPRRRRSHDSTPTLLHARPLNHIFGNGRQYPSPRRTFPTLDAFITTAMTTTTTTKQQSRPSTVVDQVVSCDHRRGAPIPGPNRQTINNNFICLRFESQRICGTDRLMADGRFHEVEFFQTHNIIGEDEIQ